MGWGAQCAECRAARFWHALIFKAYWPSYTHLIDGCCGQHILPRSLASCAPFLKDQSKNFKACAAFWETGCVACRSAKVRPTIGQAFCRGIGAIGTYGPDSATKRLADCGPYFCAPACDAAGLPERRAGFEIFCLVFQKRRTARKRSRLYNAARNSHRSGAYTMANTPCKLEHARTWPHGIQRIALLIPSYRRPCPCRCSATGGIDHSVFIRRADRLVAGGVMAGDPRFWRGIFMESSLGSAF